MPHKVRSGQVTGIMAGRFFPTKNPCGKLVLSSLLLSSSLYLPRTKASQTNFMLIRKVSRCAFAFAVICVELLKIAPFFSWSSLYNDLDLKSCRHLG